jgi:hypothetical protein
MEPMNLAALNKPGGLYYLPAPRIGASVRKNLDVGSYRLGKNDPEED